MPGTTAQVTPPPGWAGQGLLGQEGLLHRTIAERSRQLRDIRRHLHRHPELSHEEHGTTDFVVQQLQALGLQPTRMPRTGAICDIAGSDPDLKPVALRADMDALGIPELSTVSYRSTVDGVSHACGHDVHMSAVIGAAHALVRAAEEATGCLAKPNSLRTRIPGDTGEAKIALDCRSAEEGR